MQINDSIEYNSYPEFIKDNFEYHNERVYELLQQEKEYLESATLEEQIQKLIEFIIKEQNQENKIVLLTRLRQLFSMPQILEITY